MYYGGIALPSDLYMVFSNIEKESESVPTPDCEDSSSCFKYLSTGAILHYNVYIAYNNYIIIISYIYKKFSIDQNSVSIS